MSLRRGKTKTIPESSIDSALLEVEIYNKPRTSFRVENYIALMVMAWTRLFHAHFNNTMGDKYYYKSGTKYKIVDGERKAWELSTCISKYGELSEAEEKNLRLFIGLRNKIEHRHIEKETLEMIIFGECQAMLYNYENTRVYLFGDDYAINENLDFSLQFSRVVTKEQRQAQRNMMSTEVQNLVEYINKYRTDLSEDVYNSSEFSIKLIAIPKVATASRSDIAISFLRLDSLTLEELEEVQRLNVIVKDKIVRVEAINSGRHRPSIIVKRVKDAGINDFSITYHTQLWQLFNIRPPKNAEDSFITNTTYCYYDQAHNDFLYTDNWTTFIIQTLLLDKIKLSDLCALKTAESTYEIKDFE